LGQLLSQFPQLFSGALGLYPHRKLHLKLEKGAQPLYQRHYPVPRAHYEAFKKELEHLVKLGVLVKCGASEWAAQSFIIPKKDGCVQWISHFRARNKVIKQKIYRLPHIQDILRSCVGHKFFTKLDISMQYYTFELSEEAKQGTLCYQHTFWSI
jgi:hypothetical protein